MGATRWLWSVGVRVARVCVQVLSGGFSLLSGMGFTGSDSRRFRIYSGSYRPCVRIGRVGALLALAVSSYVSV